MQADGIGRTSGNVNAATAAMRRLEQASGEVVGSTFFGTILKMSRDSDLKGAYGHGGRGEDVFTAQLHGLYAEQLGAAMKTGLGDAIYRTLGRQQRLMGQNDSGPVEPARADGSMPQTS